MRDTPVSSLSPPVQVEAGTGRKAVCVRASEPQSPRPKRPTVGLDVPCKKCGRPIYFNYKGPVEGLCGRCADTVRRPQMPRHSRRIGFFAGKRSRGWKTIVIFLLLAVLGVGGYLAYLMMLG